VNEQSGDFDLPLARPASDAPVATLWVVLTALFDSEPATRAGNPGFARGSMSVAEVYTAARAVEWLIRLSNALVHTRNVIGPSASLRVTTRPMTML
jgi:hypothetical protein